ncbi:MAG TPA: universal stress protein [Phycisphaeraceae bacterium]
MNTLSTISQSHPRGQIEASLDPHLPRRILACLSLSSRTPAIAAEAWRIAQAIQAECCFLHVGPADSQAQAYLRHALAQAKVPHDIPLWLFEGKPPRTVEQVVRQHRFDLVVAGVLNRQATFSRHFRSVAGRIAASSPCSVLLLTDPRVERQPFKRIVAAVDFDDLSRAMLSTALAWGRREGVEHWHIVHEYDPSGFYSLPGRPEPRSRTEQLHRLEEFIRPFDWSGIHLQRQCLLNKHGCDAVWYAQTMRADMLCLPLSARRQGFWERMLRFRLDVDIHALPCAVLLYRKTA